MGHALPGSRPCSCPAGLSTGTLRQGGHGGPHTPAGSPPGPLPARPTLLSCWKHVLLAIGAASLQRGGCSLGNQEVASPLGPLSCLHMTAATAEFPGGAPARADTSTPLWAGPSDQSCRAVSGGLGRHRCKCPLWGTGSHSCPPAVGKLGKEHSSQGFRLWPSREAGGRSAEEPCGPRRC